MGLFGPSPVEKIKKMEEKRDVEGLINILNQTWDDNQLALIFDALNNIGDARAVEPLCDKFKKLASYEIKLKMQIINILEKLGATNAIERLRPSFVDNLIDVLNQTWDDNQLYLIMEALDKFGDARAIRPLLNKEKNLAKHEIKFRILIINLLGKIGVSNTVEGLEPLLNNEDSSVRQATIDALGQIGNTKGIILVFRALKDNDVNVAAHAKSVLSRFIENAPKYNRVKFEQIIDLINIPDNDIKDFVITFVLAYDGAKAAIILSQIQNDKSVPANIQQSANKVLHLIGNDAIETMLNLLKNNDKSTRINAINYFGQFKDVRAVEPLLECLNDKDRDIRVGAFSTIELYRDLRIIEPLIWHLNNNPDAEVRLSAVKILGQHNNSMLVLPLINALSDSDKNVRISSITILGNIRDEKALDALIKALNDSDNEVRLNAIRVLGQFNNSKIIEPLVQSLKDTDKNVRNTAAFILSQTKDARILDLIAPSLIDPNIDVRLDTVKLIEKLGDMRGVDLLMHSLKDDNINVRNAAALAINNITEPKTATVVAPTIQEDNTNKMIANNMVTSAPVSNTIAPANKMPCKACGAMVKNGIKFCTSCGAPMNSPNKP